MTRGTLAGLLGTLALGLVGCGGGTPEAEGPVDEYGIPREDPLDQEFEEDYDEVDQPEVEETEGEEGEEESAEEAPPEPEFTEGMSVTDAINAVPPGIERVNIEDEVLARPLMDPDVYAPCKPGRKHFKIRVAVWDGRPVGIDVDSKDKKLAECIRKQIEGLTWRVKAKSLNTVEYGF